MSNVMTIDESQPQEKFRTIRYKVALNGNYVQAVRGQNVGEVLNLNGALNPKNKTGALWGKDGPDVGYPLQGPGGMGCSVLPGADGLHWLLKLFDPLTGNELAAGAIPAKASGDADFFVEFAAANFK